MRKVINKILSLIRTFEKINHLEIDKNLKNKIRSTWVKVFFLKRYDSKNREANIVGFKVKFFDYWMLFFLFNEIFLNNDYYFVTENDSPFIIDCGSNIGMSIVYFKMLYPNSHIVAFEPENETYLCLKKNVKLNFMDSVTIHKAALSDKEGRIELFYDQENAGSLIMSTKNERISKQKQIVKASLLSKHINKEVDFLKIDIEGAELEVMEELSNTKKIRYIKQMVIEYHHHIVCGSDVFSKMLKLLENAGFGYQIESRSLKPLLREQFQDILVYAYRKESIA